MTGHIDGQTRLFLGHVTYLGVLHIVIIKRRQVEVPKHSNGDEDVNPKLLKKIVV